MHIFIVSVWHHGWIHQKKKPRTWPLDIHNQIWGSIGQIRQLLYRWKKFQYSKKILHRQIYTLKKIRVKNKNTNRKVSDLHSADWWILKMQSTISIRKPECFLVITKHKTHTTRTANAQMTRIQVQNMNKKTVNYVS